MSATMLRYGRSAGAGLRGITAVAAPSGRKVAAAVAAPDAPPGVERSPDARALPPRRDLLNADGRVVLKNLRQAELAAWAEGFGETAGQGHALFAWMYRRNVTDSTLHDTTARSGRIPQLRRSFIAKLEAHAQLSGSIELHKTHVAKDGTQKLVFRCTSGEANGALVETVLIPMVRGREQKPRLTICVSSQVGCAMNCQFCYTGRMGLMANLSTAQIVEQILLARQHLAASGNEMPSQNIVFMGMGEPFHNLDAVLAAVDILVENGGLQFARDKITVSTVGLVPEIRRFAAQGQAQLAVSLHATTDEVRNWIAPINRKFNLATLIGTLAELYPSDRSHPNYGRFVLIEYVMLKGVNDTADDAVRLGELLQSVYCAVNLIVFNPHQGTKFEASDIDTVKAFQQIVRDSGKLCTIRDSRGDDEMAACGQLGSPELAPRPAPTLKPPLRFRSSFGAGDQDPVPAAPQ